MNIERFSQNLRPEEDWIEPKFTDPGIDEECLWWETTDEETKDFFKTSLNEKYWREVKSLYRLISVAHLLDPDLVPSRYKAEISSRPAERLAAHRSVAERFYYISALKAVHPDAYNKLLPNADREKVWQEAWHILMVEDKEPFQWDHQELDIKAGHTLTKLEAMVMLKCLDPERFERVFTATADKPGYDYAVLQSSQGGMSYLGRARAAACLRLLNTEMLPHLFSETPEAMAAELKLHMQVSIRAQFANDAKWADGLISALCARIVTAYNIRVTGDGIQYNVPAERAVSDEPLPSRYKFDQ